MSSETSKFDLITCSRCGKKLIFFTKSVLIRDNKNDRLCYTCYQNMFFPDIKEYDTEMLDYSSLATEI